MTQSHVHPQPLNSTPERLPYFLIAVCRVVVMRCSNRYATPVTTFMEADDGPSGSNALDWAESYVQVNGPRERAELEQGRAQAVLAFGSGVLSAAYAWHFCDRDVRFWIVFAVSAATLIFLGILRTLAFIDDLGRLAPMIKRRKAREASK
jgi:hypothetical protein